MNTAPKLKSIEMKARLFVIAGIVFAAAFARIIPHVPNFTPIAAMALFAGATLTDKKTAILMVFAAMILSDLIIGFDVSSPFVYCALLGIVLLGALFSGARLGMTVLGASAAGSVLFFIVTNFGVWFSQTLYPKTLLGLELCYAAGLPFLANTLLGDLFYTAVIFGLFGLLERAPSLAADRTAAV